MTASLRRLQKGKKGKTEKKKDHFSQLGRMCAKWGRDQRERVSW